MYLGYQGNKIKFYTEQPLDTELYNLDRVEETDEEYALSADNTEYVLKDASWEEEQARKERERINMLSLTKREVFLALYRDKNITPLQLRERITDKEAQIEFDYAEKYYRGNPLIDIIGMLLGYTSEQLDYLFEHAEFPPSDSNINSQYQNDTQEGGLNDEQDESIQNEETLENTPDSGTENEDLDNNEGEQENDD